MKNLKIVLLGGGSLYFESVIAEIATTPELHGSRVVLYDIDARRMDLIRRVGERISAKTGSELAISATGQLGRALDGADFAIASIGVHGPKATWHKQDSDVAAQFGIIHTTGDTVGPGGLSQGLRIIPIFVHIARNMEKYCPQAILLNHSNPMGPICRSVRKYTKIHVIGYCHNVAADIHYFGRVLDVPPEELQVTAAGCNHMMWLLGIAHRGKDVYPTLKRKILKTRSQTSHVFAREILEMFDLFPIGGDRHMVEFFPHSRLATSPKRIPYGLTWRSEAIRRNRLSREISKQPEEIELKAAGKKEPWIPDTISPEAMGLQIKAMTYGPQKIHFVNVPNARAVPNLPEWAVIETKAAVGIGGATPLVVGELPPQAARWTLAQIHAHELTVDAAVEGSRHKAIQALACDPMIRDFYEARKVFDAIVAGQGDRLKRFR